MSNKLPSVTSSIPRDLRAFIDRLREVVSGGGADRLVSAKDLIDAGIAAPGPGVSLQPPAQPVYGTPPSPTGVQAAGAIQNIILTWDSPQYPGHDYAEVWGASTDVLGDAVLLGFSPGATYVDAVGPSVTRYYWVRFVNVLGTRGPYNAVNGVLGQTGSDVAYLLSTLSGQITESQLFAPLNARINLVDAPVTTPGSVNARLAVVQAQVNDLLDTPEYNNSTTYQTDALVQYNGAIYQALQTTTGNLPTNTNYWLKIGDYSSLGQAVAAQATQITTLTTDLAAETAARTTLASAVNDPATGLAATRSTLLTDYYTKTAADSATSSAITALSSSINNTLTGYVTSATLTNDYYTKTQADNAISQATSTLVSTTALNTALGNYTTTAALQTNYYTKASGQSLEAQYTVKTDLAGRVAGFGLASSGTVADGTTSEFGVVADRFFIAAPNDYTQEAQPTAGVTTGKVWYRPSTKQTFRFDGSSWVAFSPVVPFVVQTTPTVINGVSVPAGVYIDAANIRNGTITAAKIGNAAIDDAKIATLSAGKITAGSITAGQYIQSSNYAAGTQGWFIGGSGTAEFGAASIRGQLTASQIDTRGLSIKDLNGNIILAAGTPLAAANVSGLGTLATQNAVNWNTQLTNIPAFGNFAYLSAINSANISSYISAAAIGEAYIANAAISTAKIADLAIGTAKIANNAVTVAVSSAVESPVVVSGTVETTQSSTTYNTGMGSFTVWSRTGTSTPNQTVLQVPLASLNGSAAQVSVSYAVTGGATGSLQSGSLSAVLALWVDGVRIRSYDLAVANRGESIVIPTITNASTDARLILETVSYSYSGSSPNSTTSYGYAYSFNATNAQANGTSLFVVAYKK